jgi:type I restriction enzyme S subunit
LRFLTYHLARVAQQYVSYIGNPKLMNGVMASIGLALPPPDQQCWIAQILSMVDETIEQTEALIAKYQQIKAGLMCDLFTRGVTPDGKLRPTRAEAPQLYKESPLGWIPKDWEVNSLTSLVDFLDSKRVPLKEEDRAQMPGQIPYYGASGIIDYIDRWLFDEELILLGEDGENVVSRNLPLAFRVSGKCWVNNHAHVLKPKVGYEIDYWTEYLEWRDYTPLTSGSAQPKITQNKLGRMLVSAPLPTEQKLISERFECFGQRIAVEQTHLQKLRQQKHGLMHDLLTGRVRVKVDD